MAWACPSGDPVTSGFTRVRHTRLAGARLPRGCDICCGPFPRAARVLDGEMRDRLSVGEALTFHSRLSDPLVGVPETAALLRSSFANRSST